MLTELTTTLPPGLSCPTTFIAISALLSSTSIIICCPQTLSSLPSSLTTIPATCVPVQSIHAGGNTGANADANHNPPPIPTTLQTVPATLHHADLKPRATTTSHSTTSHSTTSHPKSASSTRTTSSATSTSSAAKSTTTAKGATKYTKMHISTALKIILVIVVILFILTLILIGWCCYSKISAKRQGNAKSPFSSSSSMPSSSSNGSGLGIGMAGAGVGGGNAYGLGAGQGSGVGGEGGLAGPNGREREVGEGYEGFRENARRSWALEEERRKVGLVGGFVKP